MRKVKIASSRWNEPREYETDSQTWGELKSELGNQILNYEGSPMRAVLRGPSGERNVLVDSSTLLPEGDFAVLLTPEKVKSGERIVYNTGVFKDMKTKFNRILDFMIEVTEKGGEVTFKEGSGVEEESLSFDLEEEEDNEVDELILLAREIEATGKV